MPLHLPYPATIIVEPTQEAALALVDTCSIGYAAFSTPVMFTEDSGVITCSVPKLGDVLLSLHIQSDGLKAVDLSTFGVSLHSGYFVRPCSGLYEINIPISLLNVPPGDLVLMLAHVPGASIQGVVATFVVIRPEERSARIAIMPSGAHHFNMLDVSLCNGEGVARAFFEQDGTGEGNWGTDTDTDTSGGTGAGAGAGAGAGTDADTDTDTETHSEPVDDKGHEREVPICHTYTDNALRRTHACT